MLFWFSLLLSLSSHAYIPEYSLIASRAAEQHGRGTYLIEQDVTYKRDAESFTVKETWLVQSETSMRVTLEGRGPLKGLVQGTIIYQGAAKLFADAEQGVRTQRLGDDWLEPLFHFRYSKYLRDRLVALKVTPPETLKDRAPLNSDGDPQYTPPGFIRLSRVGGGIAYAIGLPPSMGARPTLWIEQDRFVVRKFRTATQDVIKADDYFKFDDSFFYPRQRSYTSGGMTVSIQTLQVKALGKSNPTDARFSKASLKPERDALRLPETEGLREFYLRFR